MRERGQAFSDPNFSALALRFAPDMRPVTTVAVAQAHGLKQCTTWYANECAYRASREQAVTLLVV